MAISEIVKTKRDGSLQISDLGAANTLTVNWEAGDFSLSIPGPTVIAPLDRGQFGGTPNLRYSDDAAMTGTWTAYLRDISDDGYSTLEELVLQSGDVGNNWTSTLGANAEVFTVDLTWTIEGTDHGDASDHVLVLPHCVISGSFSEGDPDQVSISFTSYANYPSSIT